MVPGLPRPPNGNDSRPAPRSLEELMDAPAAPDPEALLREAGQANRDVAERERRTVGQELARRLMMPLEDLLPDGGA